MRDPPTSGRDIQLNPKDGNSFPSPRCRLRRNASCRGNADRTSNNDRTRPLALHVPESSRGEEKNWRFGPSEKHAISGRPYCRLIATNQRRRIAIAISDPAIIRMASNCNSNDPAIFNPERDWSAPRTTTVARPKFQSMNPREPKRPIVSERLTCWPGRPRRKTCRAATNRNIRTSRSAKPIT